MADLLEQSLVWLDAQRRQHMSRMVTYQRGVADGDAPGGQAIELPATIGKTVFEIDDGAGALLRVESRDFLVCAGDLALDEDLFLPQRGDRIIETVIESQGQGQCQGDGERRYIYEVCAPGREPHYRYSDPYRLTLRIHTKLVEES